MLLAAAAMSAGLSACDDKKDDPTPPEPPTPSEETLTGRVTGVMNLSADITYTLDGQLLVEDGGTLNIPAGKAVKFTPGKALKEAVKK